MSNSGDYEILYCKWAYTCSIFAVTSSDSMMISSSDCVTSQGTSWQGANCWGIALRAKTESGPPTPVCWASMSWVRNTKVQRLHPFVRAVIFLLVWSDDDRDAVVVPGVWLEGSDGTDINALCRSHSERLVAVADDFCKVHLFQYPCPKPKVKGFP